MLEPLAGMPGAAADPAPEPLEGDEDFLFSAPSGTAGMHLAVTERPAGPPWRGGERLRALRFFFEDEEEDGGDEEGGPGLVSGAVQSAAIVLPGGALDHLWLALPYHRAFLRLVLELPSPLGRLWRAAAGAHAAAAPPQDGPGGASGGRVLVVGLGGGCFPSVLAAAFPAAGIHAVELDAGVAELARVFFGLRPAGARPLPFPPLLSARPAPAQSAPRLDELPPGLYVHVADGAAALAATPQASFAAVFIDADCKPRPLTGPGEAAGAPAVALPCTASAAAESAPLQRRSPSPRARALAPPPPEPGGAASEAGESWEVEGPGAPAELLAPPPCFASRLGILSALRTLAPGGLLVLNILLPAPAPGDGGGDCAGPAAAQSVSPPTTAPALVPFCRAALQALNDVRLERGAAPAAGAACARARAAWGRVLPGVGLPAPAAHAAPWSSRLDGADARAGLDPAACGGHGLLVARVAGTDNYVAVLAPDFTLPCEPPARPGEGGVVADAGGAAWAGAPAPLPHPVLPRPLAEAPLGAPALPPASELLTTALERNLCSVSFSWHLAAGSLPGGI